jgi:hypothetical protein
MAIRLYRERPQLFRIRNRVMPYCLSALKNQCHSNRTPKNLDQASSDLPIEVLPTRSRASTKQDRVGFAWISATAWPRIHKCIETFVETFRLELHRCLAIPFLEDLGINFARDAQPRNVGISTQFFRTDCTDCSTFPLTQSYLSICQN